MKIPISIYLILIAGALFAQGPKVKTSRDISEYRNKEIERAGGWVVYQPTTSHFLFLNSQSRVPEKELRQVSETLSSLLQYSFVTQSGDIKDPIQEVAACALQKDTAAVVLICENPSDRKSTRLNSSH
mgnify:FL=1